MLNTRPWAEIAQDARVSTFRDDGAAALDWVAPTSRACASTRCSSRVEPGAIRAALPASPPDAPEPFAPVLRDLDEVLHAGDHALAEPAVLRLLRHHGGGARASSRSC